MKPKTSKANLPARNSNRPFVLVNMAMTADGKIATANREVSSFGSPRDHEHLLELRATADAVMAGARTVDSAEINLGPGPAKFRRQRLKRGLTEYNLRVIVSGSGSIHPQVHVFTQHFSPIILLTAQHASAASRRRLHSLADEVKVCGRDEVNLLQALRWLKRKWGVKRLLCEGGGDLNDALFRAGLVDELHLTICPLLVGGRRAPTIAEGLGFPNLASAAQFELQHSRRHGNELFLVFRQIPRPARRLAAEPRLMRTTSAKRTSRSASMQSGGRSRSRPKARVKKTFASEAALPENRNREQK